VGSSAATGLIDPAEAGDALHEAVAAARVELMPAFEEIAHAVAAGGAGD